MLIIKQKINVTEYLLVAVKVFCLRAYNGVKLELK